MARSSSQNYEQFKLEAEIKSQRFLYVLTVIVVALTIMQIGNAVVSKSGADSLLGPFGSVFGVFGCQTKENKLRWLFVALMFSCLIGTFWLHYS